MTNATPSPTPIYDRVSAALNFNPVPGQSIRKQPTVVREARIPVPVQARPEITQEIQPGGSISQ